jgi:hypothetical protein
MSAVVSEMNFYGLPTTITKPGGPDLVEYRRLPTVVARIPFARTTCQTRRYQRKPVDLIGLLELSGAKFAVIEPPSSSKAAMEAARYDLTGGGVTLAYFTFGDLKKERILWYSDGHRSLDFDQKDVRTGDMPDLDGRCVMVSLKGDGLKAVTATLLVPSVCSPAPTPHG